MKKYFIFLITILSIFITRAYAYYQPNNKFVFKYSSFDENRTLMTFETDVNTFKTLYEKVMSIEQNTYNISFIFGSYNSYWFSEILLFDKSITSVDFNVYYSNVPSIDYSFYEPYFTYLSWQNISYSQQSYNTLIQCLSNNDCSNLSKRTNSLGLQFYSDTLSPNYSTINYFATLYYSDIPWYLKLPSDSETSSNYYRPVYIDDTLVDFDTKFPTYIASPDEPVIPDEPDVPEYVGNTIDNYVYWFYERDDEIGVLVNLYILLFFYCFISLTLKFLRIIKHTYF